MASTSSDRRSSNKDFDLDDLYQQLRDLEVSDQRLTRQIRHLGIYQRIMRNGNSEGDALTEISGTKIAQEFLDAQSTALSGCQTLLSRLRDTLRKDINTCSRASLRPLTILDMPDEILVRVFEYVKGWEPDARFPAFTYDFGVREIKNVRLTCSRFCNASSHLLLPFVRVELNSASVDTLNKISKHPVISKGVRAVRVVLDYYDSELAKNLERFAEYSAVNLGDRTDRSEWMAFHRPEPHLLSVIEPIRKAREFETLLMSFARGAVDDPTFKADLSHQDLILRAHEEYRSRTADQNRVCENGAFVRSVATAIGRMPLATRLELRNYHMEGARYQQGFSFREGDDEHFLWQMLLPMTWDVGRQWALGTPLVHMLIDLPWAVHEAAVLKILDFEISALSESDDILTEEEIRSLSVTVQQMKKIGIELGGRLLTSSEYARNSAEASL